MSIEPHSLIETKQMIVEMKLSNVKARSKPISQINYTTHFCKSNQKMTLFN